MVRKDDLINAIAEKWNEYEKGDRVDVKLSFNEIKDVSIHLREISGGRYKADYAKMNSAEMIDSILRHHEEYCGLIVSVLEYDEKIMKKSGGSHCLPIGVIKSIEHTKKALMSSGNWKIPTKESRVEEKKKESERFGKVQIESKQLYPYETTIPRWVYLSGADLFAKTMSNDKILVGQITGDSGFVIHGNCDVEENGTVKSKPSSIESCAIAMTVGKVSKVLELSAVLENSLVNKDRFIMLIKTDFDIKNSVDQSVSKEGLIKLLTSSPPFKSSTHVYLEKVKMIGESVEKKNLAYESISSVDSTYRKTALVDAGRVFMFEILFGMNERMSQIVKRNVQIITKVYTNPRDVRIRRIIETVSKQSENRVKMVAEDQFSLTKTILDDAMFIEGMNEVRWKVAQNSDMINEIVDKSNMNKDDKDILKENIDSIKRQNVSLADIIEQTFRRVVETKEGNKLSPLKHKSLHCTREEK